MCSLSTVHTHCLVTDTFSCILSVEFLFKKTLLHDCSMANPFPVPIWVQPTVTFPIGDHVNVLHDYKKTRPSKILKLLTCRCHHLIDMLVEFSKNHIFLTLKMLEHAISVNVYQFLHKLLFIHALW